MTYKEFHGYKVYKNGDIQNKYGNSLSLCFKTNIPTVKISIEGHREHFRAPNLILCLWEGLDIEAFKTHSVVYKDGNKYNNHLYNLEFGETKANRTSLSLKEINEIKSIYYQNDTAFPSNQYEKGKNHVNYDDLAAMFNVSKGTIHNILKKD